MIAHSVLFLYTLISLQNAWTANIGFVPKQHVYATYSFGFGYQIRPMSNISSISFNYQPALFWKRYPIEFGLRIGSQDFMTNRRLSEEINVGRNDVGELIQNSFRASFDALYVHSLSQPMPQLSLEGYIGTGFHYSEFVYSNDPEFGYRTYTDIFRLPEIPIVLGFSAMYDVFHDIRIRIRYLHTFALKKDPETSYHVPALTRGLYQYSMFVIDVGYRSDVHISQFWNDIKSKP